LVGGEQLLRDFYDRQSDYQLDEDDAAYTARKALEAEQDRLSLENLPCFGLF
jgi:hypothetical protein